MTDKLTQAEIKSRLTYDEATGIFMWKERTNPAMRKDGIAGYAKASGYVLIKINGKMYQAHRLAWLYVYGAWPAQDVDHIDRNPNNNQIANLRLATPSQNGGNRKLTNTNKTGYRNVSYHPKSGKYYGYVREGRRTVYLGLYDTPLEASAVVERRRASLYGDFNLIIGSRK